MTLPAAVALGILIAYAIACTAALVGWMNPERRMKAFIRDYYDRQDDGR